MIRIQCPAKINLNLKIVNKREDGFHNIESVMQTINLYDYLTIETFENYGLEINLTGNSAEIPYDERNLVYKAANLYCKNYSITNQKIKIHIEKNIPICAGLGGGSTDAAGTIYGLNKIFNKFDTKQMHELCAELGSDLNICLKGGRILCKGRGEILEPQPFQKFNINLIKPKDIGISAKDAYTKFAKKQNDTSRNDFENDLEWAIIEDYPQLQTIKKLYPTSIMTGSGSTYFSLQEEFVSQNDYWVKNGLKSISTGVKDIL